MSGTDFDSSMLFFIIFLNKDMYVSLSVLFAENIHPNSKGSLTNDVKDLFERMIKVEARCRVFNHAQEEQGNRIIKLEGIIKTLEALTKHLKRKDQPKLAEIDRINGNKLPTAAQVEAVMDKIIAAADKVLAENYKKLSFIK